MKTTILFALLAILVLLTSKSASANDEKYLEVMRKNIDLIYKAQTIEDFQQTVNSFERIALSEKSKWEPFYYAAFGYIMMANREKDGTKKDAFLDQALSAIEKGKAIKSDESELIALEGFAYMIRVTVDPAARGPQFAGLAMQTYGNALKINPENPRALSLLSQMQYGTAQFFGSSTGEACATLKAALEKFDTYQSANPLAPQWGKGMAESMRANCQ